MHPCDSCAKTRICNATVSPACYARVTFSTGQGTEEATFDKHEEQQDAHAAQRSAFGHGRSRHAGLVAFLV